MAAGAGALSCVLFVIGEGALNDPHEAQGSPATGGSPRIEECFTAKLKALQRA
jgi:hypothetical protein